MVIGRSDTVISMLQLFVAPTPFEGWGERAYDGTSQRQLLAVLLVSFGALALTLCVALLMLFADEPLGPPDQGRTINNAFRLGGNKPAASIEPSDCDGATDTPLR